MLPTGLIRRKTIPYLLAIPLVALSVYVGLTSKPATHASGSAYDATVLGDHPVAYWAMNNPSGSEPDLSGNNHTGSYVGGAPSLTTTPNGDQTVDFNGSSQYLAVPSSSAFSIPTTHQLTWEAWIRPDNLQFPHLDSTSSYIDFLGKCQNYSPSCEWEGRMYATANSQSRCNRISAYVFNPSAGLGSAADWQPAATSSDTTSQCSSGNNQSIIQARQWLHVVGEYQTLTTPSQCNASYPGTINIWVNGVQQDFGSHHPTGCMSQYSIVPQALGSPLNIGTMARDSWFDGAVGKVAVYNYLLTSSQISAHFAAMTGSPIAGVCGITCIIPVPTQNSASPTITGDLNVDSVVNIFDLSLLLSNWGTNNAVGDLNSDNTVNIFDLSVLLSHWGQTSSAPVRPLDAKISGVYWPNWTGTPSLRSIPVTDNLIYAAFAYGDGSQSGNIIWKSDDGSGVSSSQFISDLQYDQARGQKVVLSIGGSNDFGIHMTNSTQVTQMVNSINQIVTTYGFNGIDWDLENDANITAASIVSASNQLKQRWGPNFIISMAPAPNDTLYKQAAQQLGSNLDVFSMQFYDYAATDSQRISDIVSRIDEMVNTYQIPAKKLGIGAKNYDPANPTFVSAPSVYQQAYDQLEVTYPDFRGAYVWEAILESTNNWPFANTVGKAIRQ